MIKVSILTAAYNATSTIARTASSVLAQTYPPFEWIIASDDGQDYNDILKTAGINDLRIRFTSSGCMSTGASATRNRALNIAQGEIIAVLDADDTFAPDKLEKMLPHVLCHGAATCDLIVVNDVTGEQFPSLNRKYPARLLSSEEYLTANLHSYSMQLWDRRRVDIKWDETVLFAEDMVHGVCLFDVLPGIYYTPEPLHFYHRHALSMCNSESLQHIIRNYETLIMRAEQKAVPMKNVSAQDTLLRYLRRFLMLEKKFLAEQPSDPLMGFYHFIAKNQEAFYFW